eukprot:6179034-Pleurochrysis_carterae.AAC.3
MQATISKRGPTLHYHESYQRDEQIEFSARRTNCGGARACRRHRLPVRGVGDVAARKDTGHTGPGRAAAAIHIDVFVRPQLNLAGKEGCVRLVADGDKGGGDREAPPLSACGRDEMGVREPTATAAATAIAAAAAAAAAAITSLVVACVVALKLLDDGGEKHRDGRVRKHAFGERLGRAQLRAAMHECHVRACAGEHQRLLHGCVAAADDERVLAAVEEAVACRAARDPLRQRHPDRCELSSCSCGSGMWVWVWVCGCGFTCGCGCEHGCGCAWEASTSARRHCPGHAVMCARLPSELHLARDAEPSAVSAGCDDHT